MDIFNKLRNVVKKEVIRLAITTSRIGDNGYEELNQNNLQNAIDSQFGTGKAIVRDNGDGTYKLGGSSQWATGYIGEFSEDGTIIGEIPQYISIDGKNFKPVTSMPATFRDCTSLVVQPKIPTTVTKLQYTFWNCANLVRLNKIHNGVTTMEGTYMQCTAISDIPELPNSVTCLTSTFAKTNISVAPKIPDSVTIMSHTFRECHNLKTINKISDNAELMHSTFYNCYILEGELEINANPTDYENCFAGCSINSTNNLILKGSSEILTELLNTKSSNSKIIIEEKE